MSNNNNVLWSAGDGHLPQQVWQKIEDRGYRVLLADGKVPILESIQKLSPCLLVSEVNGGSDSSLDLFAEIKTKYPDLPVVLISPHPSIEEAVEAIKLGITDWYTFFTFYFF